MILHFTQFFLKNNAVV